MHHDIEVRWIKLREAQALLEANENEFEWMVNHKDFPPVADIDGDGRIDISEFGQLLGVDKAQPGRAAPAAGGKIIL